MSNVGLMLKGAFLAVPCCIAFMLQFFGGGVGGASVPSGAIAFFAGACPADWTEYAALQGRYLVGMPAGGTITGTSGTAMSNLESRAVGQHNHGVTDTGHTHAYDQTVAVAPGTGIIPNGTGFNIVIGQNTVSSVTGLTVDNEGAVAGTNAPYIQLRACSKN
jgi:hypothetical protein